ncbi:solute carrier family 25 member 40 [Drosophila persimilis]|uniref:solute carrier family 25 member 40 n=1 Tax=Drosophila persimilis TaxID=7234 RepID=UPI000F09837D|nr:solute carrier family 25 member 40 [Drosophila persimilis]
MSKEEKGAGSPEAPTLDSEINLGRGPRATKPRWKSGGSNDRDGGSSGSGGQTDTGSPKEKIKWKADEKPKKELNDPRFRIRPLQQVVSACTGAMITALFMTPLDVIKTRMQTQQSPSSKCFFYCNGLMDHLLPYHPNGPQQPPKPLFTNSLDALFKISRNEGPSALWSGLGPTLVSALPSTIIYFVAYEQFKARYTHIYEQYFKEKAGVVETMSSINSGDLPLPVVVPMLSGVTARICAVTVVSPIELVRTKMQAQPMTYAQMMGFVRNVLALQGIWGLWRGLPPTILRDVPFSGIYWPIYEHTKRTFGSSTQPSFGLSFVSGVLAGSVAALVTTPFDVVKTHEQIEFGERVIFTDSPTKDVHKRSTFSWLMAIYRSQGLPGLFAGYGPRLFKVAPACAIMISTFEYSKSYFFYYNVRQHNETLLLNNPNATLVEEDDIE